MPRFLKEERYIARLGGHTIGLSCACVYLPHVEFFSIDEADVSLDQRGVIALPATHNETEEGIVWSVSCRCAV